jgi:hypothetical protein
MIMITTLRRLVMECLVCLSFLAGITTSLYALEFAIGADLSFLKQAEDSGFVFKDGLNASFSVY